MNSECPAVFERRRRVSVPYPMSFARRIPTLLALISLLAGCATYPLGVSKSEWDAMSPAKRDEYWKLQSIADGQKRQDAEADRKHVEQSVRGAEASAIR